MTELMWIIVYLTASIFGTSEARRDCFTVTDLGPVKGSKEKSRNGNQFCSFRGIPYAQPPVGDLRFKAPQDRKAWKGILNARHSGPLCIQNILGIAVGHEDCLYLNVYCPEQMPENREKLYPVIMYIHGGKFTLGSGISFISGPTYLMNKDVILVTINYRLGVMGFLSTGDSEAPGNYGMKDQVAALRWIRNNIVEFGGDPGRITLMGQSAGSKSVHFHMFSSTSKGLFHGAISQSGSVFMPWALPPAEPLAKAKQQAQVLSCFRSDSASLVNCLRSIEPRDLVRNEIPLWQPVIETQSPSNPEPFLTASPIELVKTGNFYKVPWLMGSTSDDGAFFGARKITNQKEFKKFTDNLNSQGPEEFFLSLSMNDTIIADTWNRIKEFYFHENDTVKPEELSKLYTDRYVVHAVHKASVLHSQAGHTPVFRYNFAYRGLYSFVDVAEIGSKYKNIGVVHMDDLIYLIPMPVFNVWPPGHPDKDVIELMVTLWTNFATHGNPSWPGSKLSQAWKPLSKGNMSYLQIGHSNIKAPVYGIKPVKLSVKTNLHETRMKFWDALPLKENA